MKTLKMASNHDDEVSTVLRHFCPRPKFISSGSDHHHHHESKQLRTRKRLNSKNKIQRKYHHDRGFSSVKYVSASSFTKNGTISSAAGGAPTANRCKYGKIGGVIQLTYLHVEHTNAEQQQNDGSSSIICIFLSFEIDLDTKSVSCVRCIAPSTLVAEMVQTHINKLCEKEFSSSDDTASYNATSNNGVDPSVFSVASRLLQLLNNNFPSSSLLSDPGNNNIERESTLDAMVQRIASACNCTRQSPKSRLYRLIDLQILLMRCAAAGRQRSNVCTPVPVEFAHEAGRNGDALARLVFDASNQLYLYGFRGEQQNQQLDHMQQRDQSQSSEAWTLLPFLLSLPWVWGSRLKKSETSSRSNNDDGNGKIMNNRKGAISTSRVGKLCLDIQTSLGDPSPAFSQQAKKYGTVQAYHGTKIESAWSILNHGLQNLSYNAELSQNGAMMGAGVYLSTSLPVAESFAVKAAEGPPRSLSCAFQHESLLHLLCYANVDIASLDPLDTYDIKCLPVFEATIIKPPPPNEDADEGRGGGTNDTCGKCHTRQEGKYFVCSDSEFVRITRLHLTIELSKKSDIWKSLILRLPLSVAVLLVALLWKMR